MKLFNYFLVFNVIKDRYIGKRMYKVIELNNIFEKPIKYNRRIIIISNFFSNLYIYCNVSKSESLLHLPKRILVAE
jgi:hypothetical protein